MDLGQADPAHAYFMPAVRRILADGLAEGRAKRVFNLGCGNGATAQTLAAEGWEVAGVDPSEEGIAHAYASGLDLRVGSAYDDLAAEFRPLPVRALAGGGRACLLPTPLVRRACGR
jgi:2-polyprenyl-6-hydroxyphenyl methylase/3-demethylubiquinone-9 3-methyltransferase